MRMGYDGKFVMDTGYDTMVAMVAHRVHEGCRKVVTHMLEIVYVCLPGGQGQMVFCIGHVCVPLDGICYN